MKSKKHTACSASRYPAGRGHQKTLTRWGDHARWAAPLAFAVLLIWGTAGVFVDYLDRPEVHISYLTRECVRVVNADGSPGSCGSLPDRYKRVWVE